MLPEIGATELLVIAAVALIVVGPKDLPVLLRKLGQFMARLRSMAADFRSSFDEMARQSELDDLRKEVDAMRRGQLASNAALEASEAEISKTFQEIDDGLRSGDYQMHPPMSHQYAGIEPLPPEGPPDVAPAKPRVRKASTAKPTTTKTTASKTTTAKAAPKRARKTTGTVS